MQKEKKASAGKQSKEKTTTTKAERRAIQEAQRAMKAAAKGECLMYIFHYFIFFRYLPFVKCSFQFVCGVDAILLYLLLSISRILGLALLFCIWFVLLIMHFDGWNLYLQSEFVYILQITRSS